jgi:putative AdoMet-dependent methyltransferase
VAAADDHHVVLHPAHGIGTVIPVRSSHADVFNHDAEAAEYDVDVLDESNPIRTGYEDTLRWVVARAAIGPRDAVVDLGVGTGNLAHRLPGCRRLVCVDVSARMLELAQHKVGARAEYVQADLLQFFDGPDTFDAVVSTYAIHHLTTEEKLALVGTVATRLNPGGRLVVGDLMVATSGAIPALRGRLAHPDVDDFLAEEFPWEVDATVGALSRAGFRSIAVEQLSELSWGLAASSA